MKTSLLILAILTIAVQNFHSYWVIDYVSNLESGWKRLFQNWIFCFIISAAILILVFLKIEIGALIAAVLEIGVNAYYTYCSNKELELSIKDEIEEMDKRKKKEVQKLVAQLRGIKRKLIGAYALSVIIPSMIYLFTYLYVNG